VLSCEFVRVIGRDDRRMTVRLLYLLFSQVLRWLALLARSSAAKDPSCSWYRHEVAVLSRRAWRGMLVQPTTLLRWHPDLTRRLAA
jgi:hypothetical protein